MRSSRQWRILVSRADVVIGNVLSFLHTQDNETVSKSKACCCLSSGIVKTSNVLDRIAQIVREIAMSAVRSPDSASLNSYPSAAAFHGLNRRTLHHPLAVPACLHRQRHRVQRHFGHGNDIRSRKAYGNGEATRFHAPAL